MAVSCLITNQSNCEKAGQKELSYDTKHITGDGKLTHIKMRNIINYILISTPIFKGRTLDSDSEAK